MFIHDALFDKVGDQIVMNVLFYLVRIADENGNVHESYSDIGKAVGYSKSTTYRCVKKLLNINALKLLTDINRNDTETLVKRSRNEKCVISVCNIAAYKRGETLVKRSRNDTETISQEKQARNHEQNKGEIFFEDETMNEAIKKWLKYKKERKQTYKPMGLAVLKTKLLKLSHNDGETMMKIVEQSIANNYLGLFPLKEELSTPSNIGVVLHNSKDKDYTKGLW